MSEPELPGDIQALLAAEREAPGPSPEVADRLFSRVEQTLEYVGGAEVASAAASASTGAAVGAAGLTKTAAGIFVAGAVVGTIATLVIRTAVMPEPEPPAVAPVPAPVRTATAAARRPAPPAPARPAPPEPKTRTRRPVDTTAKERALLERARTALGRNRPEESLTALREHQRRYPRGRLREERDALRVAALAQLGRDEAASKAARRFLKRYPKSLFRPMVEQATPTAAPAK